MTKKMEDASVDTYSLQPGTIEFNIKQTITAILLKHPFYGFLLQTMKWKEASNMPTMATDGKNIYYNAEFFNKLTIKERTFAIAHEIFHCMVYSIQRTGGRDRQYWNMASDYAINANLIEDKVGECRKDWLYDPKYAGLSADEIYKLLVQNKAEKKQGQDMHLDPSDGLGQDSDGEGEEGEGKMPKISEDQMNKNMEDFKREMVRAYQNAKMSGELPKSIQKIVDEYINPRINWKTLLQVSIRSLFKNDTTWQRPNRRSVDRRFILPTTWFEDTVDVCVSIDTSGSISDADKVVFLSEVMGILTSFKNCKMQIWCFDTEVHAHKVYAQNELSQVPSYVMEGGGGTSIQCNFDYMKEKRIKPKQLVVFTDGFNCSDFWGDPNYCDTVFIIHSNPNPRVPFGRWAIYEPENRS